MRPHETMTKSGIVVPDPDQGVPYVHIQFAMPSTAIMVWEPFSEEEIAEAPELAACGHNLHGFARRWADWTRGRDPFLEAIEVRFAFPQLIPRSAIGEVVQFSVQYHRAEDVRAGVRGIVAPRMRQLADGSIEVMVPR